MLEPNDSMIQEALLFNLPDLVLVGEGNHQAKLVPSEVLKENKQAEVGGEDPDELLYQVAQGLLNDGNFELAEPLLTRLLHSLEKRLSRNHPALAKVANMLAVAYVATEKYDLAETYAYRALTIWEKQEGAEMEVARTLNNLASIYNSQGQYQDGEFCLRRAFSAMEELATENPESVEDSDLLPILENFCLLLKLTGRHSEAALLDARIHGSSELPMAANQ
jgi:tetratricopeptide (TPR) repeat protein